MNAGTPDDWWGRDSFGTIHTPSSVGVAAGVAKLTFSAIPAPFQILSVTYDNARGAAYNVLLQPLFTGVDFPTFA